MEKNWLVKYMQKMKVNPNKFIVLMIVFTASCALITFEGALANFKTTKWIFWLDVVFTFMNITNLIVWFKKGVDCGDREFTNFLSWVIRRFEK
jgi:hypothetical protein